MKRLLIIGTSAKEIAAIKQSCGMSFIIDEAEHLETFSFLDSEYSAVLLLIDDDPEIYLNELQQFTYSSDSSAPPVMIATRNPDSVYIRRAIRRGAIDYLDLTKHYFLIKNRISNIMKLNLILPPSVEALNRLLFYRCIGPALMVEVSKDESMVQSVMVNNDYFKLLGITREFYSECNNLLDTILPEEREQVQKAIHNSITGGSADCTFSNPANQKTFQGTYRLVVSTQSSSTLLLTLRDITDVEIEKSLHKNMLRLPGMTLFTYEPETDSMNFLITTKKNKKIAQTQHNITDSAGQKFLAPESFLLFSRTIKKALAEKVTGNIDIRALFDGELKWVRMYYRSIPDSAGRIIRIVGRMDDLESTDYIDVKGIQSGLCDAETHLPTFHTTFQFIDQILQTKKQGTLMLLNISGLEQASEAMEASDYQEFLQSIVWIINDQFISTDLIGRFDTECFIAFMPETTSRNLAPRRAEELIRAVQDILPTKSFKVNIGICIIDSQHGSLESIVSESSIALWNAMEAGDGEYRIFDNDHPE